MMQIFLNPYHNIILNIFIIFLRDKGLSKRSQLPPSWSTHGITNLCTRQAEVLSEIGCYYGIHHAFVDFNILTDHTPKRLLNDEAISIILGKD